MWRSLLRYCFHLIGQAFEVEAIAARIKGIAYILISLIVVQLALGMLTIFSQKQSTLRLLTLLPER